MWKGKGMLQKEKEKEKGNGKEISRDILKVRRAITLNPCERAAESGKLGRERDAGAREQKRNQADPGGGGAEVTGNRFGASGVAVGVAVGVAGLGGKRAASTTVQCAVQGLKGGKGNGRRAVKASSGDRQCRVKKLQRRAERGWRGEGVGVAGCAMPPNSADAALHLYPSLFPFPISSTLVASAPASASAGCSASCLHPQPLRRPCGIRELLDRVRSPCHYACVFFRR